MNTVYNNVLCSIGVRTVDSKPFQNYVANILIAETYVDVLTLIVLQVNSFITPT